jgi:hypothetical protein
MNNYIIRDSFEERCEKILCVLDTEIKYPGFEGNDNSEKANLFELYDFDACSLWFFAKRPLIRRPLCERVDRLRSAGIDPEPFLEELRKRGKY